MTSGKLMSYKAPRAPRYHMTEDQVRLALDELDKRKWFLCFLGEAPEHSFAKIAKRVGVSAEAVRKMSLRDMSPAARALRRASQYRSAALLLESEEIIAAGWIVCHDMLRLNTSVENFVEFLGSPLSPIFLPLA